MKLAIHLFVTIIVVACYAGIFITLPTEVLHTSLSIIAGYYIGKDQVPVLVDKILKIFKIN